jgi:hypothetical protein
LLAVDAEALPLTYDPTVAGLDLPIVQRPDSVLTRALGRIRTTDSTFFGNVDAARIGDRGAVIHELGRTKVILGREPTAAAIAAAALVRRHLGAIGRPYDELDVRFEGRVIVRGSGA